ncbi:MAG: phosphatase PAP2 family protein [Candidatus Aphodocola sp.]
MLTKIKNNKRLFAIILLFFIAIAIISAKIMNGQELSMDKFAYNILVMKLRNPPLTIFMKTITKLSNTSFIIILTIILTLLFLWKWKNIQIAQLIPCNLIASALLNQILKLIFQRERPNGYRLIEMSGYSFPSGHAMVSMAFYGLLIYIIYRLVKNKNLRNILIAVNVLIIILIGISRVYLGVHYLSDVLTGYSISIIYLLIVIKLLNKYKFFP